jgi:putative acetyltransferase
MTEPILIRPERADHPQVQALLAELDRYLLLLYKPEENHILDVQALLDPSVTLLGAWRGSELLGCGAVRRMPAELDTGDQPYGEIKRMMVAPAARGQGVAQALLSQLEALLRHEGFGQALLETGEAQTQAVRLYQRCGYVKRAAFGGYPDNGLSLFMAKAL